jgi:hypothetical protein
MMKAVFIFVGIFAIALSAPIEDEEMRADVMEKVVRDFADENNLELDEDELDELMNDPFLGAVFNWAANAVHHVAHAAHHIVKGVFHGK